MQEFEPKSFAKDFLIYCSVGFNIGIIIGLYIYVV